MASNRIRCFFDVDVDSVPLGRIIFELFDDVCPKTVENFRALCTGEVGIGQTTNKLLHYRGVKFHRVIKDFMVQAGDFSAGNGTGGESIYGGQFEDENFEITHDTPFLLSMANRGKDTNGSQFFITTQTASHLDGKHVVFGRVISGQEVVVSVENLAVDNRSRPLQVATIANCGELVLQRSGKVRSKEKKKKSKKIDQAKLLKEEKRKKKKKKEKKIKQKKEISRSDGELSEAEEEEEEEEVSNAVLKGHIQVNAGSFQMNPLYSVSCINPDEIPDVPKNRFLDRGGGQRDDDYMEEVPDTRTVRSQIRSQNNVRFYSKSGRKVKGRGALRYRTPSRSRSRTRSRTPPHWRQAQRRTLTMDKLQRRLERDERRQEEMEERKREYENRVGEDHAEMRAQRGDGQNGDWNRKGNPGFEKARRGMKTDNDWRVARQKTMEEEEGGVEEGEDEGDEEGEVESPVKKERVDLRDKLLGRVGKSGDDMSKLRMDGGAQAHDENDDTVLNYELSSEEEEEKEENGHVEKPGKQSNVNGTLDTSMDDDRKKPRETRKRSMERWHRGGGGGGRVNSSRRGPPSPERRRDRDVDRIRSGSGDRRDGRRDRFGPVRNRGGFGGERRNQFGNRDRIRRTPSPRIRRSRSPRNIPRRRNSSRDQLRKSRSPRNRSQRSRSPNRSKSPKRKSESPKSRRSGSQTKRANSSSPGRRSNSPKRKSRSPRRHSRSPRRHSRSPKRHQRSTKRNSRSPRRRSRSHSKSPKGQSRERRRKSSSSDDKKGNRFDRDHSKSSDSSD